MTDKERSEAVITFQQIARDRARQDNLWVDIIIARMELEFRR